MMGGKREDGNNPLDGGKDGAKIISAAWVLRGKSIRKQSDVSH